MDHQAIITLSAGSNDSGELCRNGDDHIPSHCTELKTSDLVGISIGGSHCAVVYGDGSVFGWGDNSNGAIGFPIDNINEYNNKIRTPKKINGLPPIIKVMCGDGFTLFLSENKEVFMSTNNKNRKEMIEKVETGNKNVSIFGYKYPWIVCEDGSLFKIKNHDKDEAKILSKFELPKTSKSKKVRTIINPSNIEADICLTKSGEMFGMGKVSNNSKKFVKIESLKNQKIKKVSGICSHIVALTDDGKVFGWGDNLFGQLGLGNAESHKGAFVEIPKFSDSKIVDISAGDYCSVFADSGGNIWATGSGGSGQTLFGDEADRFSPERVASIEKAVAVLCGSCFTYVQIGNSPISHDFPIFDNFPNAAKRQKRLQNEKDEIEKKFKRLKEKNHQLKEERKETNKRLEMITKEKEEIEEKYESLEKEKLEVEKINDELRNRNRELESKDSGKMREIEFLDEEALRNLKEVKKIGRGATSEVIEVVKEEKYALKIMKSEDIDENQLKHFFGEYEILNSLNHRNIIKTFGISFQGWKELDRKSQIDEGGIKGKRKEESCLHPIILLEYCPRNLSKKEIEKMGKLEKIKSIYEIVEGMICVHSKGIIHRDLKPENILINSKGIIKICDFGISTLAPLETHTKGIGTVKFMAPELLNEEEHYSEKVDIYAFGFIIYFILTNGEYPKISLSQIVVGKKAHIPDSINSISKSIIKKCWSFSAEERPSFIEIKEEMKRKEFELFPLSKEEKKEIKTIISNL